MIGSLVPIDFGRNANFLLRLFQTIYHSIRGNEPFTTLAEAWPATLCGTVLSDVLYSSGKLFRWAQLEWDRMIDRYVELQASSHIRRSHIYEDVERFLRDYTDERGVSDLYREALSSRKYFPETTFYILMGAPERLVLRDDVGEDFRRQSSEFDMLGNRKGA